VCQRIRTAFFDSEQPAEKKRRDMSLIRQSLRRSRQNHDMPTAIDDVSESGAEARRDRPDILKADRTVANDVMFQRTL
jgi:hypothetical protein